MFPILGLLWTLAAPPDPILIEADRLTAQATARRAEPGGAVDLLRLTELAEWLPAGALDAILAQRADDAKADPLVRAVAEVLRRDRALQRLDPGEAQKAAKRLELIDAVQIKPGPAPHSTAIFERNGWRKYPRGMGAGTLRLDAVVRPNQTTRATIATRVSHETGGPAVLRLGYDDAVVVWLNGDEIYQSPATHPHFIDQAAIPVVLRAGANRLVVSVQQKTGAWRLSMRFTDAQGVPITVSASDEIWGAVPEPADGDPPADVRSLWTDLLARSEAEPPVAQDLRDFADYARITGLPNPDQSIPRVAVEGTWVDERSPRSLRAWLRLLPEDERASVRTTHPWIRPIRRADVHAALRLRLSEAWQHYYARRHRETRTHVEALIAEAPDFAPAQRLRAVLDEDLGLAHRAVARLTRLAARFPDRVGAQRAVIASLRSAERIEEAMTRLRALVARPDSRPDDRFQLASLHAQRGETDAALALLDAAYKARPDLVGYALEAAEIAQADGRAQDARRRLQALAKVVPSDAGVALKLAALHAASGAPDQAVEVLTRAQAAQPGDPDLKTALERLTQRGPAPRLGPSLANLRRLPDPPNTPAHVLYHHARTAVNAQGLAVRRVRRVVRIQNEEGARRFAQWQLPYVPSTQRLELLTARLYREGAAPASPTRSDRDLSEPEYRLYYDLRAEVLDFPPPRPGDVIEVAWRLSDTDPDPAFPGYYGELAYLQEVAPRAWSVIEVEGPEGLQIEVAPRGLTVERSAGRIVARNVPGIALEADTPGPSSMRAYVHVSTAKDWSEVDRRYRALLADRDQPTAALATLAEQWGGQGDARTVFGRLYAAVAARTRYVGLEFGVRSFLPAQPAVTLARGYGDCKDKATLLIALARARGIDAHLTLVRSRPAGAIAALPASFAVFDHAIVYVPSLERFVDPTVDRNDPWTLPPGDQGAKAFVVGVDTALRTIPVDPPAANPSAWGITARLQPDGRAVGRLTWTTRGQPAFLARRSLEAEGARKEYVEQLLARRFTGATIAPDRYDGLSPAFDPVVVGGEVTLPPFRRTSGGFDIPVGGAPWRLVARFAQAGTRKAALALPWRRNEQMRLQLELPAGMRARTPSPIKLDGPFGRFRAESRLQGQVLTLTVQFELDTAEVAAADYPAFRAWLARIDQALARVVEVRRE